MMKLTFSHALFVIGMQELYNYYLFYMDWNSSENQDQDNQSFSSIEYEEQINFHLHDNIDLQKPHHDHELEPQTPEQLLEFTEENITCQICCKYALNALLCANEKCRKLLCSACVESTKKTLQNKCPFCRMQPFACVRSPHAKVINNMKLTCHLCKSNYGLQRQEQHFKQQCSYFQLIDCRYCNDRFPREEIVRHNKQKHLDKIDEIFQIMYTHQIPALDPRKLLHQNKLYLEKIGKTPHLGTTGKFYCAGKLQTKCSCCNGSCGPSNGENCVECMKLDIKRLGLRKGFLLNSSGNVCWLQGEDFMCGTMLYYDNGSCSQGNTCTSCRNMKKNIKRYQDLI